MYSPDGALRQGQAAPLEHTYCDLTLKAGGVLSINRVGSSPHAQHPFYQRSGYESYIGAALTAHGALYGTLAFMGSAPRTPPFTSEDEEMVILLARWVGIALEAKIAEEQRRESEARFRSAFHDTAVPMAMVTPDGRLLESNASVSKLLGYSHEELLALDLQRLSHPDDLDVGPKGFQKLLSGEFSSFQLEKRYLHKEGHTVWGILSVSAVRRGAGSVEYLLVQVQDITPRKHYEEQVRVMAYRDELTGLHNRRYFFESAAEQLSLARQEGWPVALIYLDLNGFKVVNDALGHQAGDELLQLAAARFRSVLRDEDLLARLGGDEFAVLLLNVSRDEVGKTADRLTACLKSPFQLSSGNCEHVGVSVGVVAANISPQNVTDLLKQADLAMYRAKERKTGEPYAVEVISLSTPSALSLVVSATTIVDMCYALPLFLLQVYEKLTLILRQITSSDRLLLWPSGQRMRLAGCIGKAD